VRPADLGTAGSEDATEADGGQYHCFPPIVEPSRSVPRLSLPASQGGNSTVRLLVLLSGKVVDDVLSNAGNIFRLFISKCLCPR
jgi:hypothetical protein